MYFVTWLTDDLRLRRCSHVLVGVEGVGIVVDDVHPSEIESAIKVDYLISLTIPRDDIQRSLQQFRICPVSTNIYSARELAMIRSSNESSNLAHQRGFSDVLIPEVDNTTVIQEPPPEAIIAEPLEGEESDQADTPADPSTDDDNEAVEDELPPPEPTPMEKNEINPPVEDTFPVRSIMMEYFSDRYKRYVNRVQAMSNEASSTPESGGNSSSPPRFHVIPVLAMQSLSVIREQCVQAITGVSTLVVMLFNDC